MKIGIHLITSDVLLGEEKSFFNVYSDVLFSVL